MKNVRHHWNLYENLHYKPPVGRGPPPGAKKTYTPKHVGQGRKSEKNIQSKRGRPENPEKNIQSKPSGPKIRKKTYNSTGFAWLVVGCWRCRQPARRPPVGAKKHTIQTRPAGESGEKRTIQAVRAENPKKNLQFNRFCLVGCWLLALSTTHAEAPCGGKNVRYN